MIGLSAVANKIRLPYPILLIVAGIAIGFIPTLPEVEINPEIIFLLFLPPLLYDAAFNISFKDFRTHFSTISSLAITLVFLTASGIAVMAYWMIPGLTWPLAFTMGAILSATDAVAAMSITKDLGLSHQTNTILEGESLINDASALVTYRFAVAAVMGSAVIFWKATLDFAILMGGGVLLGLLVGKILAFSIERIKENAIVTTSLMLIMPFITYLLAEKIHTSGVIAVVTLGLSISRFSKKVFPERLKNQSRAFWDIIIFLLNGLIFILIGLEFPYLLKRMDSEVAWQASYYALIITITALVLRMSRVFLQRNNLQKAFQSEKRKVAEEALLDFKTSLIISWSGMRGIVSLAMAIALPKTLGNGEPFPFRDSIIFFSVLVVLYTLIGQGLTLPWIIKKLNQKAAQESGRP